MSAVYYYCAGPGGGIGRRRGLKPPRGETLVRVQVPSRALFLDERRLSSESSTFAIECSWHCLRVIRAVGYDMDVDFVSIRASVFEQLGLASSDHAGGACLK